MDVVVIAAGRGTRMRPLTNTRPKPLLPVGEYRLIGEVLRRCQPVADRFIVVTGYRGADIEAHLGDRFGGVAVDYVTQPEPAGTADAVAQVREHVTGRFLVVNADVIVAQEAIAAVADAAGHTLLATRVDNPGSYGVVETEGRRLRALHEKPTTPPSNRVNAGVYAFTPPIFEAIDRISPSPRGEYELTAAIERAVADGATVSVVDTDGPWLDVGRPWELLDALAVTLGELPSQLAGTIEDGATIEGAVRCAPDARIRAGAYLEGPVVIGAGADVGPNAYIRGPTVIGPDVRVGNGVEIKASILSGDTNVGHLAYVGDSVLGEAVNFGAGTVVANLRHDDRAVRMRVDGTTVDTGRRKLGVVVGARSKTGINTSLNAGVVLGVEARTTPGAVVTDDRR